MTPTTKTETAEALEERAAKLRAEAAEAEAEIRRRADAERRALAARQEAHDRELVAKWDPKPLDAEVEATAAALDRALRADPVVLALVAAFHAQSRRRFLRSELIAAQSRLGADVTSARLPDAPQPPSVTDLIARTVEQISADMIGAERTALEARRNGDSQ